jgi:hypothetical protein
MVRITDHNIRQLKIEHLSRFLNCASKEMETKVDLCQHLAKEEYQWMHKDERLFVNIIERSRDTKAAKHKLYSLQINQKGHLLQAHLIWKRNQQTEEHHN